MIPVVSQAQSQARIQTESLSAGAQTLAMALAENVGYQWLNLPEQGSNIDWAHTSNGAVVANGNLTLIPNTNEASAVTILSPGNNDSNKAGESLMVQYKAQSADGEDDAFRYAEVTLFDFNHHKISQALLKNSSGTLSLHLPSVKTKDTYYLRVRGYFGDTYYFSDSEVSVQVFPQAQLPKPKLKNLSATVLQVAWWIISWIILPVHRSKVV